MYVSPLLLYVSANLSICVSENSPRLVARSVVSRKLSVKLTKQGIRGRTGGVGGGVVRGRRRAPRERERYQLLSFLLSPDTLHRRRRASVSVWCMCARVSVCSRHTPPIPEPPPPLFDHSPPPLSPPRLTHSTPPPHLFHLPQIS